jgi:hypothetical protein
MAPSPWVRFVAILVLANFLVGGIAFGVRAPWLAPPAVASSSAQLPLPVQRLKTAIDAGRHGEPYVLSLSDADLAALVGYVLDRSPSIPFGQVTIAVGDNQIVAEGVTRGMAVNLPVRVTGTVSARDGLPVARVEDVSLGDAPMPGFVRDQVVRQINASLDFSRYNLPVTVESIELQRGRMTIRGTVK